jgi:hypothetical protein
MAFSVVFGRCSTAFATKQIKIQLEVIRALNGQFNHFKNPNPKSKFFDI